MGLLHWEHGVLATVPPMKTIAYDTQKIALEINILKIKQSLSILAKDRRLIKGSVPILFASKED